MDVELEALARRVDEVAAAVAGRAPEGPDMPLDLDSLGQAELAFALEEAFGVQLPDAAELRTPHEATLAVAGALSGQGMDRPAGDGALKPGIGRLQWMSEAALSPVLGRYSRLRVVGADRVPPTGPVVLASNHDSGLDIPFLAFGSPRPVWFMAKRELFEKPFWSWFFHVMGGFPVDRAGPDLRAIRAGLAVLDSGMALGMYPEGTRSREFLPFLPGAAWMSLRTGAPLVPVAVRGTAEAMPRGATLPRRVPVTLAFGEPMHLGRQDDPRVRLEQAAKATEALRVEVERLLRA